MHGHAHQRPRAVASRLDRGDVAHAVAVLGARPARLLDVGCGDGAVVRALAERGHAVVALDASAAACALARTALAGRGEVIEARFGEDGLADGTFDAVRFGRSLHHLPDVDAAVARAARLLRPGGLVLVDELALDRMHGASAAFVAAGLARLAARGDLPPAAAVPAEAIAARWRELVAGHGLHGLPAMEAALGRHLELGALRHVPSLWAECVRGVVDDARAEAAAVELEAEEAALLAQGALPGVAFRVVGRRPC